MNPNELIDKFNKKETIRTGAVSVFGDSIGKPGDLIYTLQNIILESNTLKFLFGNTNITIIDPIEIYVKKKTIEVKNCSKIRWVDEKLKLEYVLVDNELFTNLITGNHLFKVNKNKEAFTFYAW